MTTRVKTALDLLRQVRDLADPRDARNASTSAASTTSRVMQAVFDQADILHKPVSDVMGRPFPDARADRRNRTRLQAADARQSGDRRHRRRRADRRPHAARHHQLPLHQLGEPSTHAMKFTTKAIHVGQEADPATGATIVPIYQTSTYTQDRGRRTQRLRLQPHGQSDAPRPRETTRRRSKTREFGERVRERHGRDGGGAESALRRRSRRRHRRSVRRHVPALLARPRALRPGVHLRRHERPRRRARGDQAEHEDVLGRNADQSAAEADRHARDRDLRSSRRAPATRLVVASTTRSPRRTFSSRSRSAPTSVVHSTTKYIGGHSDVVGGDRDHERPETCTSASSSTRTPSAACPVRTTRG